MPSWDEKTGSRKIKKSLNWERLNFVREKKTWNDILIKVSSRTSSKLFLGGLKSINSYCLHLKLNIFQDMRRRRIPLKIFWKLIFYERSEEKGYWLIAICIMTHLYCLLPHTPRILMSDFRALENLLWNKSHKFV